MVNEAIRIGLERKLTSRFKLSDAVYHSFNNGLHSWYRLAAIEKASVVLKNYRVSKRKNPNTKTPYFRRKFASIGRVAFYIENGILRVPIKLKHFVKIPLNAHTLKVLQDVKVGELTLNEETISISYSKEIEERIPTGFIGIDRNLTNATIASSDLSVQVFDTSQILRKKEAFSEVKSHFKRNDVRIGKKLFSKYGRKQIEFENQTLHQISKEIVEKAKSLNFGIVMENVKGIRKLYRKGNGQARKFRRRLNSWSFLKLQNMIEYKARWEGIKVLYVPPHKTSSICAICGSKVVECTERKVFCPKCLAQVDRDVNAARNILAKGTLRFGVDGLASEAVKGNEIKMSPILLVDASKS